MLLRVIHLKTLASFLLSAIGVRFSRREVTAVTGTDEIGLDGRSNVIPGLGASSTGGNSQPAAAVRDLAMNDWFLVNFGHSSRGGDRALGHEPL